MAAPISNPLAIAPSRRRACVLVAALFTFFFAAYTFTASGDIFSTGDTTIRVELAENILGRWSVDLHGWKDQYPHHIHQESLDPRISVGRLGKTYSTYLLGQPLAMVPFDKFGSALAVHERWPYGATVAWFARLVGPLFGALEVMVFFLFALRLGYGLRGGLLLTLIFGFATSVWPDEQSVLEHTEVGFFLLLAFYFAYRCRDQNRGWLYLVWSGAAVGGAAVTRYQDAFLGLVAIGLYLIWPGRGARSLGVRFGRLMALGVGVLPFAGLDVWYSWVRFGTLFASGHHENVFGYPIPLGIAGLLVSPGKGLLWYCPVILLLAIVGPMFARRYTALSVGMAAVVAGFVLLYAHVTYWHGDPCWGPRYLFPIVPFLTLPLGELFRLRMRLKTLVWLVAAAVVGVSFVIQVAGVSVSEWRTWYRVIAYEENQGHKWQWIASRYRYFWNIHESPLNFQLHGLYQLAYDSLRNSSKYELVPPDEDPVLDGLTTDYAVNQWNFWWTTNEFNWWMGERKIAMGVIMLISTMLACGTYLTAEAAGVFAREAVASRQEPEPVPEAA